MSAILFLGGAALWAYLRRAKRPPWSFDRMSQSSAAKAQGIDNSIPPEYQNRARAMGAVCAYLEGLGLRVNSVWRSEALTDALYAAKGKPKPYVGPGDHGTMTGVDVDESAGQDGNEALAAIEARLRKDPFMGPLIRVAVKEGDHLHLGLYGVKLDAIASKEGNA